MSEARKEGVGRRKEKEGRKEGKKLFNVCVSHEWIRIPLTYGLIVRRFLILYHTKLSYKYLQQGTVLDLVLIRRTEVVFSSFPFVIRLLFLFSICHVGIRVSLLRHVGKVAYMI